MTSDRLLSILERHQGKANAIQVKRLAVLLETSERMVQLIKRELADAGQLIGSSCEPGRSGYFIPVTPEEVDDTLAQYTSRAMSLLKLIRVTKGAEAFKELLGQMTMKLEVP